MISKSEVMLRAWEDWRAIRANYSPEEIARRHIDISFAASLRFAWRVAKQAAARVAADRKQSELLNGPDGPAMRAIRHAVDQLKYKSFRHDIRAERAMLEAELAVVMARAAP